MPKQSLTIIMRVLAAVFFAGLLSAALPAPPSHGADRASADPTITLDVQNEPLRNVLGRISKTTRWKITAPDKWMDKPVTQRLTKVSLDEGLRFILKDAGVDNLLLTYDEGRKTITVFDTDVQPRQSANRPPAQGGARPPLLAPGGQPDPILERAAQDRGDGPSRKTRSRSRRQSRANDE